MPQTAQEVLDVISNLEKLKEYGYTEEVKEAAPEGFNQEQFHLNLPYDDIKAFVEEQKATVFSHLGVDLKDQFQWEHIGSTSIKGMPGTKMPDAMILVPKFPIAVELIQALLDSGFYFGRSSPMDVEDLWFVKNISQGFLKHYKMTIHVCKPDNVAAKILMDTRDMCRSEEWAFEDYKNTKIEAAKAKSFLGYKIAKGSGSKLLSQLREKHGLKQMNMPKGFDGRI